MVDVRIILKEAITARNKARGVLDEARSSLKRADAVIAESSNDLARFTKARDVAEKAHAAEIAGAIRRGKTPDTAPPAAVARAQQALSESESRNRMAQAARATIAAEVAAAETALQKSEYRVQGAARAVLVGETVPLGDRLAAALRELLAVHDTLIGLSRVGEHFTPGLAPSLPQPIVTAIVQARQMSEALSLIRPMRAGNVPAPDSVAALRFRKFLAALEQHADAKLDDITVEDTPMRSVPRFDKSEAA
jgi:hypothetical protein